MLLSICAATSEGIVLASDSRQSYRNRKGIARIGSDNASKLFQINERIGLTITGLAFLPEKGVLKNISKFVQESIQKYEMEGINNQLRNLEYAIQYGTMTLQDAVDFCTLIIQTTSAIQRFSDGIAADPGDIPGVGGPVDVAVITHDNGFVWLSKKKLKYAENEIDFDRAPKIKYKKLDKEINNKEKSNIG